jgi:alkylation response protein AidB-like acyl-CoA dehydrogenase
MADAAHAKNLYKADLREIQFILFEQFRLGDILSKPPYEAWGEEEVRAVIRECYKFVCEVLGPLNSVGDAEGCRLENGRVLTPKGFDSAWQKLYEGGWKLLGVSPEYDGQGAPKAVQLVAEEFLSGANCAFNNYPGLAFGAAELIEACATHEQKELYLRKMYHGEWGGTMCLTEAEAGSDVGACRTKAVKSSDGTYRISGTKVFISSGDFPMVENMVHLVLARVEGAPPGTKGLSLFIVPSVRVGSDGTLGGPNDVLVGGIEHKMGIKGSCTCTLNFGENDGCLGQLVGGVENQGMAQMFRMMNGARIAVGIQSLATASTAYLNALVYAKERKQGPSIQNFKDPSAPKVTIVNHPDVRRMLLDMKSRVEGIRALLIKLAMHQDMAGILAGKDDAQAAEHQGQVELLTPLVKAYSSDQAFRVCETAIQTFGGAGYISDYGVEQYCRDAKIFSIYEGTNHIQAMDLVGRKLGQRGGANLQKFLGDVGAFAAKHAGHAKLGGCMKTLGQAAEAVGGGAMKLLMWSQMGKLPMVPLFANRYLEMMSETALGWLLLEAAVVSEAALAKVASGHPDAAFYQGRIASAVYFARNVLPGVAAKAAVMNDEDDTALGIEEAAFATI